jgi:predicted outer membrane repeat protein
VGGASPILSIVTLRNNAAGKGGGVAISGEETSPQFKGCTMTGNQALNSDKGGGGAWISSASTPVFVTTTLEGNRAAGYGGGICVTEDDDNGLSSVCASMISGTILQRNHAAFSGGGLFLQYKTSPVFPQTNMSCPDVKLDSNTVTKGWGNDLASSPIAMTFLREPVSFTAPLGQGLAPQIDMAMQVWDAFGQPCSGTALDSAVIQLTTTPPMLQAPSNFVTCLLSNGTLTVSSKGTCTFGIRQGKDGQTFRIEAAGTDGLSSAISGTTSQSISVADCGGDYESCRCHDLKCQCQNASIPGDFTCIKQAHPWLRVGSPRMAPCDAQSIVAITGNYLNVTIVNCSANGVMAPALNPTSSDVQCILPPIPTNCHLSATQMRLASVEHLSEAYKNVYRYDPSYLGLLHITDAFGKSPACGLFTGGKQTRKPIRIHGSNNEVQKLFALASSGKISSIDSWIPTELKCQFDMGDTNINSSAWVNFWMPTSNTSSFAFAECDPPSSFDGTKGMAGPVNVRISFDGGQHWLPVMSQFTYTCIPGGLLPPKSDSWCVYGMPTRRHMPRRHGASSKGWVLSIAIKGQLLEVHQPGCMHREETRSCMHQALSWELMCVLNSTFCAFDSHSMCTI